MGWERVSQPSTLRSCVFRDIRALVPMKYGQGFRVSGHSEPARLSMVSWSPRSAVGSGGREPCAASRALCHADAAPRMTGVGCAHSAFLSLPASLGFRSDGPSSGSLCALWMIPRCTVE